MRILLNCFWKSSGAQEIPKGSLLKQYLPNGDINVVSSLDFSARRICQKPMLASSLVNTYALRNWTRVSSTLGNGCTSRKTLSFNGLRSTQILMDTDFFGATTMPAHHGVGVTFQITPRDSILWSSTWIWGRDTFLGVNKWYGLESLWAGSHGLHPSGLVQWRVMGISS